MTGRRKPLCVVLLLAVLISTMHVGMPSSAQRKIERTDQTEALQSAASESEVRKQINLEEPMQSLPDAEYPSSNVGQPSPYSEPTPNMNSPPMFDYHHIAEAQALGAPAYDGSNVRVSVLDYGLDMGQPDLAGSQFVQPSGAYQGWPVAFDPKSMGIFLRDKKYEGTWYANTTRKGQPPFEVTHYILIDGRRDFGDSEKLREDPSGTYTGDTDGNKKDYDLTQMYVTHDEKFWYFGFPVTQYMRSNITYGLLIDVDNETSGATNVPEGKLVNTNTTHAGYPSDDIAVADVAVSPDGTMIATTSSDRHVKIWAPTGTRLFDFQGHTANPFSLAWSPNSVYVASRDKNKLYLWDTSAGALVWSVNIRNSAMDIAPPDERYSSSIAFSPDGTLIAVAADTRVSVFSAATGQYVGNMTAATGGTIRSLAFKPTNPSPPELALGADVFGVSANTVRIYRLDAANLQNIQSPPNAVAYWNSTTWVPGGAHTAPILSVSWSPDGVRIVSTAKDNSVKLWQPTGSDPLMSSVVHGQWVYASAWNRLAPYKFATVSKSSGQPPKAPLHLWDYNGNSLGRFDLNRSTYAVDWTGSGDIVTASTDLSARIWSQSGKIQRVLVANKPDFAVMIDAGLNYSLKDLKWVKVVYNGTFYSWDGSQWTGGYEVTKAPINGTQAFFGIDELFVELGVPTSILGHPSGISVELFSVAQDESHAQDTVPIDGGVFDINGDGKTDRESGSPSRPAIDFTPVETPLSGFQYVPVTYYSVDTVAINSVSGVYHFGYHPSVQMAQLFGSLGILLADPFVNGTYEKVYIDMDKNTCESNHIFDARDVVVDKANPIATCNKQGTSDSTPDISAGMIYFVADGVNYLPYSERFKTLNGIEQNNKPGNGDLVAFAGEFKLDPDTNEPLVHGTRVASVIASRGRINSMQMSGVAPAVKLIPILNSLDDIISSWYFAVEGYDGSPGTGDEAQIVLNPFEYPRTRDDGYDVYSRTADYLSTSYASGGTVFFSPAGEEGPGYGSVASPGASPGIITVGRTTDDSLDSLIYGGVEGTSVHYNNLAFKSSRGPTVSGFPKPDLVAIGNSATDEPIITGADGKTAFYNFGITGSEVSAAITAGVGALMIDAANRLGRKITATEMRNYLMSGAENLGYDILLQGAGFLNASRSMKLLLGSQPQASVLVSPPSWTPGTYKGTKPDSFTKMLTPGTGDQMTFSVANKDTSMIGLSISPDILTRWDGYSFSNKTMQKFLNDLFIWVNKSGVFVEDANIPQPLMIAPPLPAQIWDNSEQLKITAYGLFSDLIVPSGTDGFATMYCYDMILKDWTMDPFRGGYPSATYPWELNTIDRLEYTANVLEARVHRPGKEFHDALVIQIKRHLESDACGRMNLEWRFELDFYQRQQWSWISLDKTSVSLSPGGNTLVTATVSVPANAAMGSYEAAIYFYDSTSKHEIAIPILVNVGASTPNFRFGGNLPTTGLNDVNRVYGGRDFTLLGANVRYSYLGDWRFFYIWLPDEGINVAGASIKMVVQLNWTTKPSDIDMIAFTPAAAADTASQFSSTRFGPKSVREASASEVEPKPRFKTLSNQTQDYISFQLSGGLNVIALHEMILNGDKIYEEFSGSGMWWRVPREVRKATQSLAGSVGGSAMLSDLLYDGLRVDAIGPAISSKNSSVLIKSDWQDWMRALPWGQALAKGSYSYCIQLKKVLILEVHLMGLPDVTDLDLGLFRDQNDDCKLDEATETIGAFCTGKNCAGGSPQWAYDADGDADETIKWTNPPDGYYIIKVLGFDVPGGAGHFDLDVQQTLDTGTGYRVPEAPPPEQILIGTKPFLPPFNIVHFSLAWDFPGGQEDGNYSGAVRFGTSSAAGIVIVPAVIILDRFAPTISAFEVRSVSKLVNNTNLPLTNDDKPIIVVSLQDRQMGSLTRSTFRMALDGKDVSALMTISAVLETSPYALPGTTGPWGYWRGDMKYEPMNPLSNGIHVVYVAAGDEASNYVHANFTFTIDLAAPSLSLSGPPVEYLKQGTTVLQGATDANAFVLAGGQWMQVGLDGQFSIPVTLEEGNNDIQVTATAWFMTQTTGMVPANPITVQKRIVYDMRPPVIVGVNADPPILPIRTQTVRLTGRLTDEIASTIPLANYSMLKLTINGDPVAVFPDGTFSIVFPTQEGLNSFVLYVEDPAGNNVTSSPFLVTRDTVAPLIDVSGVPERVESDKITVTVTSETGLRVTVNGFDAPEGTTGVYTKTIGLSGGSNIIVVTAQDAAGNVAERKLTVEYAAPAGLGSQLFGPAGGYIGIAVIVLIVIVVAIAVLFLMRMMRGRGGGEEESEEVPPLEEEAKPPEEMKEVREEEAEETPEPETPAEELKHPMPIPEKQPEVTPPPEPARPPPEPVKPPTEQAKPTSALVIFRVTRSKLALDQGRISQKVYEQNLASMGLTAADADRILEEAKEAERTEGKQPTVQPISQKGATKEDRINALRKALDEGRISQEIYEENVRRIQQS